MEVAAQGSPAPAPVLTANLLEDPLVLRYQAQPRLGIYFRSKLNTNGAYVLSVIPHTAAAEAGLRRDDIIIHFGRTPVNLHTDLTAAINRSIPGRNYTIGVIRNNQRLALNCRMRTNSVGISCLKAGDDYDNGKGVPQNYSRAIALFRKASELGEAYADFALAMKYSDGKTGLPVDDKLCLESLHKAADNNCFEAMRMLGKLYEHGEIVRQDQALARKWYLRANDLGMVQATEDMAFMYYNGRGGPVDKKKAAEFWSWAANFGSSSSQFALGIMYYNGEGGLPRNWNIAEQWFQRAAGQGNPAAQKWLAKIQQDRQNWQQQQAVRQQQQQQQQLQRQRQQQQSLQLFLKTMQQFQRYRKH